MTASQLRHRVTLTQIVRGRDAMGGVSESAGNAVTVWANVEPVSADERLDMGGLTVRPTHRIKLRWRDGNWHRARLTFRSRAFDVVRAQDPDERRQFLELLAVAQEGGA